LLAFSEENSSLFKDLEKHVGGMKANLSTFDDLMEGLYMNDLTELEKVRNSLLPFQRFTVIVE